jgi:hypothetical protein
VLDAAAHERSSIRLSSRISEETKARTAECAVPKGQRTTAPAVQIFRRHINRAFYCPMAIAALSR